MNRERLADLLQGQEWPDLLSCSFEENIVLVSVFINSDIQWFAGHFPEQAVLPGVVQLHWATKIAKAVFSGLGAFTIVNNIKFKTMIFPEAKVDLILVYNPDKRSVKVTYRDAEQEFSTGTLVFDEPDV